MASFNTAPTVSAWGFSGPDWGGYNIMKKDTQNQWQKEVDFTRQMAETQWQRATADMQAAGINPMLAIQQGPNASPQSPHASFSAPPGAGSNMTMQTKAATDLLYAQAEKTDAERREVEARTPTHAVSIDKMRQDIQESVQRAKDLQASVEERTASAARQYQQIENLREELPRIKEDINRIRQQANNFVHQSFLANAHEKEIQQRVKANLPALDKAMRDLEIYLTKVATPGKELDAEVRQSFIGIIGNYLKALIPFGGIIGAVPMGRGPRTTVPPSTIHKGQRGGPDIHRR